MADTILDVTDNFLTLRRSHTIDNMPGRLLFDLGREVRAFARAYRPPTPESRQLPVYLGGWPSANFHAASHGQLVLSSLLYSGSVVVKDPLADWFSDEQYRNSHALTARAGHLNEDGSPNVVGTRAFLRNVLPAIEALRPLIDAGLVLLVPSESFYLQHSADIGATARTLTERLGQDPAEFARAFRPVEIPVEDTSRGNFVFAPGPERSTQVRDTIAKAMTYFAREYWLATAHGATYTAPFRFEQHVCEQGLSRVLQPRSAVVRAMLRSDLPIYRGLTAPLLKSLHDDDNFAGFREDLHHIYASVPTSGSEREIAAFIADQEQALLEPKLSEARREAERGLLGRVGVAASGAFFGISTGLLANALTAAPWYVNLLTLAGGLGDGLRGQIEPEGPTAAWTTLYKHSRRPQDEVRGVNEQRESGPEEEYWGISEQPAMAVHVTSGALLIDSLPRTATGRPPQSMQDAYRLCDCGSGLKYKFCCRGTIPETQLVFD